MSALFRIALLSMMAAASTCAAGTNDDKNDKAGVQATQQLYAASAEKYALYCGGCHGLDGRGEVNADVPSLPPRVGAFLYDPDGRRYISNVGGVLSAGMSDADTAEVLNYVLKQFGTRSLPPDAHLFDAAEIARIRQHQVADAVALRHEIQARLKQRNIELPGGYPWP